MSERLILSGGRILTENGRDVTAEIAQMTAKPNVGPYFEPAVSDYAMVDHLSRTTGTLTLNILKCGALPVNRRTRYDKLGVEITTGAAGSFARCGIYAHDERLNRPGRLLVDGGQLDTSGTGLVEGNIDLTLDPGVYWMACASQGTGGQTFRIANGRAVAWTQWHTATNFTNAGYITSATVSGALPDPFPVNTVTVNPIMMGMRVASFPS